MRNQFIAHLLDNPGKFGVLFYFDHHGRVIEREITQQYGDQIARRQSWGWMQFRNGSRLMICNTGSTPDAVRGLTPDAVYISWMNADAEQELAARMVHGKGLIFDPFLTQPLPAREYWKPTSRQKLTAG